MNNKEIMDERKIRSIMLTNRNGFISSVIYLLVAFVYNQFVLNDSYIRIYLLQYMALITLLLVVMYIGVTSKAKMRYVINLKYLKKDEMEKYRFNSVLGTTGMFAVGASVLFLIGKLVMGMPELYQNLDMYLIGIYGITLIISSLYYKDITLPRNIKNIQEFYNIKIIRVKTYAKEALYSMLIWTAIGTLIFDEAILELTSDLFVNMFLLMLLRFLVFFVLDYIFGELGVKRALQVEKEMDDE